MLPVENSFIWRAGLCEFPDPLELLGDGIDALLFFELVLYLSHLQLILLVDIEVYELPIFLQVLHRAIPFESRLHQLDAFREVNSLLANFAGHYLLNGTGNTLRACESNCIL